MLLHHQSFQRTRKHWKASTQFPKHPTIAAGMNSDRAPGKESNLVKRQIVHYHHMLMQAQKCNSVDVNQ